MTSSDEQYIVSDQFEKLLALEKDTIRKHRNRNSQTDWNGIALSGGGIRSAIFCLGALRALAERNVLGNFDYMSSVSGGGYTASALHWLWGTDPSTGTSQNDFPFGTPANPGNAEKVSRLQYLRSHGQYLTPDEHLTIWSITAVVIRTVFLNLAVWLPIGASVLAILIVFARPLEHTQVAVWLPNFYSFAAGSKWKGDCIEACHWPQEIFFGLCTAVGLLILAAFAVWALAFSLDTRISPKWDIDPRRFRGWRFGLISALSLVALYFVIKLGLQNAGNPDVPTISVAIILGAVGLIFGFLFFLQIRGSDASANYGWRRAFERLAGGWMPWVTIIFAIGTIPIIPFQLINHAGPFIKTIAAAVGALSGILSAVVGHNAQSKREVPSDLSRWGLMAGSAVFLYFIALLAYALAQLLLDPSVLFGDATTFIKENIVRGFIIFSIFLAWVLSVRTNVNYVGLHRFYRDRLMEGFMPASTCVAGDIVGKSPGADTLSMAEIWPPSVAATNSATQTPPNKRSIPYPLINTNAIMINDEDRKLASRGGDSFVISPMYVGCAATGWERTARHVLKNGPLSLPSAMAASGAALDSNAAYVGVGVTRDRLISIVLMLLNLRLGMWVGRPSNFPHGRISHEPNHINPAFRYGMTRTGYTRDSHFVELSDGGHFDNLGIYELVRRKLSVILTIDGEEDSTSAMPALYSVAQRVRDDFGAVIRIDNCLDDLIPYKVEGYPKGARFVKFPFFVAPILYNDGSKGIIIYIKLSLTEQLGFEARGYRAQNPDFPQQSTADQFFTPEQIDAYLQVGYVNATTALAKLGLTPGTIDVDDVIIRYNRRNDAAG